METTLKHKNNLSNQGKIISVRGSVVDVWFEDNLPPINTLLHSGENNEAAIEVHLICRKNSKLKSKKRSLNYSAQRLIFNLKMSAKSSVASNLQPMDIK